MTVHPTPASAGHAAGDRLSVAVIGAGGVGGPFAAALFRAGHRISFVARGAHLDAIRAHGLKVEGVDGETLVKADLATAEPSEIGPVDLVLFTVKLWDVEEAAAQIRPLIGPATTVVPLQNGVDAPERVAAILGRGAVAAGTALVNGGIVGPGLVRQFSAAQAITVGELEGGRSPRLERLARILTEAGIKTEVAEDPAAVLWEKFVQLVPISATTALTRRPIGEVRDDPDTWRLFMDLLGETVAVGRAEGVAIPDEAIERRLAYVRGMPHQANASMAKDLAAGRRLELPWLGGKVQALGRRHGVATPANDFVGAALKLHVMGRPPEGKPH